MRTLRYALVVWAFNIAVIATIICSHDVMTYKLIEALFVFWLLGSSIPATLEDTGLLLAEYFRLYKPGEVCLLASHVLYKLPLLGNGAQRNLGALGLARIALMQGDYKEPMNGLKKPLTPNAPIGEENFVHSA